MDGWLASLAEPFYGIVDAFLDRPLATLLTTSVAAAALLLPRLSIQGWPSGHAKDSEDTLQFCARFGVRPMIETFPLERAAEAYDHMMTGRVRFRSVLTMQARAS